MRLHKFSPILAIAVLVLGSVTPTFAVSKEMIQLQTQVQALTHQMARMQQNFDERMGVMRNLIEQSTDSMNKLASSLDTVQKATQQQSGDTQGRVDQLSGQIQSLHDSLDELKARLETAMWKAAEAAAFEQAAQHRDALQQVDAWFTRQKAASADLDDTDVYGSAVLDGRACVHRLMLREGRMVGRQEYLLDDIETFDGAVLAQVIQRVYGADPAPVRILVEVEPEDSALLSEWLSGLRGSKVRIHVPQKGEKVDLLAMAQENARLALERKFEPARLNEAMLEGLQAFLGLSHLPRRLECFDISHGQGREVVASCVVFSDGVPDKARYRRFKMTNEQNDDFANMQEAVLRRYKRIRDEKQEFPNLVLIDGGLGQLHAAEAALRELGLEQLELASLAKKEELVFRPGLKEPLKIPKSSPVLQLLQRIRDEAHRFAITYHRALRAKRTLQTELTQIPGIGPATAKKLLQAFGSVSHVRVASEPDLARTIGEAATRKVMAWRDAQA